MGKRWLLLACCCLPAAACLLLACCLPAACAACCCLLLLAAACCCLLLLAAACCLLACWLACWLAGWLACCLLAACLLLGWEGRSFSLFDGLGWRRGPVAQGVPHFMLWSMMALGPALDNSWIRGRSGGRSGGRSVVFSALVFICVLCSFFIFSFFLTDCYFFSFHCFLRSLSLTPSQIKPLRQNDCL